MPTMTRRTVTDFTLALVCLLAVLTCTPAYSADAAKAALPGEVGTDTSIILSTGTIPIAQETLSCEEHTAYLVSIISALNANNQHLTAKIAALEAPRKEQAALDAGLAIQQLTAQYLASHKMRPGCTLRIDGTFVCPDEPIAAAGEQPRK